MNTMLFVWFLYTIGALMIYVNMMYRNSFKAYPEHGKWMGWLVLVMAISINFIPMWAMPYPLPLYFTICILDLYRHIRMDK